MILITGGGGFLGLNIARALLDRGGQSVLLVQRHRVNPHPLLASYWETRVKQESGDVRDRDFVLRLAETYGIESIVHGAFHTAPISRPEIMQAELARLVQVEVEGTLNLLELMRTAVLRRLTFLSSVDCYRGWQSECDPWQEDAFLPPVSFSPIGNCKRAAEQLGLLYSRTYGFGFAALRIGRVYGPGAPERHPIRAMVEGALTGRPVDLPQLAGNTRTHTVYAKDVGEAVSRIHLAPALRHPIYNVSDGSHPTMLDIGRAVQELIPAARITLGPPGKETPHTSNVSVERVREEFGFVFRDLKTGLEDYMAWMQSV